MNVRQDEISSNDKNAVGKKFKTILWTTVTVLLAITLFMYWQYSQYNPVTDDAYIQANIIQVAPQVSGPIFKLYVKNYDVIKKGDSIFDIDPAPFLLMVNSSSAELDAAKQDVQAQQHAVEAAQALVEQRQAELVLTQKNYERTNYLIHIKQTTQADADKATSDLHVAESALTVAKNQLLQAKATLGNADNLNAHIRFYNAQLQQAQLNLQNTHVLAPADGYIVNLSIRPGTMQRQGITALALVDSSEWWVEANFKETQLERIHKGQAASITTDIYPNRVFHGVVENVSYGSGAAFSLFPAENATGNWVKVTQRFPVRITILDPDATFPLRVGASATVKINASR